MKPACILLAAALTAGAADTIEAFGYRWRVPVAGDWKVLEEDGVETLRLLVFRPSTQPRRPVQYALAEPPDSLRVRLEVEVKREPESPRQMHPSLILVYAWRDAEHFNYAHLSADAAADLANHNGIFHVPGGDRVRISGETAP
ncbi:MAG TPA: hypothetical protein VLH09_11535 [Bryobacteraceae bacterium]|nr:hypothetical protein [Bryobacteraceae bacterium]